MTTSRFGAIGRELDRRAARKVKRDVLDRAQKGVRSFDELQPRSADSTWVPADPSQPALFDRDPADLADDLSSLWADERRAALLPLAEPMARLARKARSKELVIEEDVSSDVYAMQ